MNLPLPGNCRRQPLSILLITLFLFVINSSQAQTTGTVFRDYNGNGTKQANEPFVPGVTVNAYNASEALVGSSVTSAAGSWSITPTGGYPIRIEFVLTSTAATNCFFNQGVDFNGYSGATYGSNVRFLSAQATGLTYAISYPGDYVTNTNPKIATSVFTNGNLTAGAGNSGNIRNALTVQYSTVEAVSPTPASNITQVNLHADMGSVWGVTHHVQSGRLFYAAVLKRHSALGPNGSGAVYNVNPSTTTGATLLFDLDGLGFPTRATGTYAYAATTGQALVNNIPFTGVIGTTAQRGIPNSTTPYASFASPGNAHSYDAAAFAQVGKVGLGGIDVSDDGRYVFVMNLFDRKLYRITLVNPATPGTPAVTAADVKAFTLTDPAYTGGTYRPWAVKYYRGKVFVGMTNDLSGTALLAGTTSIANGNESTVPKYANAKGSIYSLDDPTTSGAGTFSLVTDIALNYPKLGAAGEIDGFDKLAASAVTDGVNENHAFRYNPWTDDYDKFKQDNTMGNMKLCFPQPILSDIEFDMTNNSVAVSIMDRLGLQCSYRTYSPKDNGPDDGALNSTQAGYGNSEIASGDVMKIPFTAICAVGTILPNNSAANNEFYTGEYYANGGVITPPFHQEITSGGSLLLPGTNEIMINSYDPSQTSNSGGLKILNNTSGAAGNDGTSQHGANVYDGNTRGITPAKGIGMGDIEYIHELPPIEIGNRVWNDANGDGIQNAGEAGIGGVALEIFVDNNSDGIPDGAAIGTTTTALVGDIGSWYFNNANITGDADPNTAGTQAFLSQGVNYIIRPAAAAWAGGVGIGALANLQLTKKDKIGYGAVDLSDNDAGLTTGANPMPQISYTPSVAGANNHNLDFGFKPLATLGDKVWRDDNTNGTQDAGEPGVAGITLTLYNGGGTVIGATTTDAYGNYLFDNLAPGTYTVGFTLPANYTFTQQNTAAGDGSGTATDSDPIITAGATFGRTRTITLVGGQIQYNVDAGIKFNTPAVTQSIGDKVWLDNGGGVPANSGNGVQDANEPGVSGINVTLYDAAALVNGTTISDANGNYLFTNVAVGSNYRVGFSLPVGMVFSTQGGAVTVATNSDVNTSGVNFGKSLPFNIVSGDNLTYIDAGILPQATSKASLGDRVWEDTDHDGIQDPNEPGIGGITVNLLDATGNPVLSGGLPITTKTDAFGYYMFTNLAAATYIVEFIKPAGYTISPRNVPGGAINSDPYPLTGRSDPQQLDIGHRNTSIDAGMYANTPAGIFKLGDKVWNDYDKDGIQDANEPGLAGITVKLYQNGPNGLPGTSDDVLIATTSTDMNGYYVFVNLAASAGASTNYNVQFSNIPSNYNFAVQSATGSTTVNDNDANSNGRTGSINLIADNLTVDAGLSQGQPIGKGSIGNKVWYDLNSNGVQDTGELGAGGVTVTLQKDINGDGLFSGVAETAFAVTTTNGLGEYMFGDIDAGVYKVVFSNMPLGYIIATKDAVAGTDDTDSDGDNAGVTIIAATTSTSAVYNLAQGEDNLSIDLGLIQPASRNTLGDYVWFDQNGDGIQTAGEPAMQGVMLTLYNNLGAAIAYTTTDANGQYMFTGIADGTYSVGFSNYPAGFDVTTPSAVNDLTGSDANLVSSKTVTVTLNYAGGGTGRDNRSLDAGLISTRAAVGNYVWLDTNGDGIQDAIEKGIAGVTVTLYASDGTTVLASAITDQNGKYLFSNLTAGSYVVGFSTIPGGLEFTQQNTPGDNGNDLNSDANAVTGKTSVIVLSSGEADFSIDAGIRPKPTATIGDYVWSDIDANGVQDATEPGIGGIVVTLYNSLNQPIGSGVTDGSGYYLISNVPPGTGYYVVVGNVPNNPSGTQPSFTVQGPNGGTTTSHTNVSGTSNTFTVNAGDNIRNIDAGIKDYPGKSVVALQSLELSATLNGDKVTVNWITLNEVNTSRFIVERSVDNTNFVYAGEKAAAGNYSGKTNYSFIDDIATVNSNPVIYYRIKLINIDGSITYSKVVAVRINKAASIKVWPNPFAEKIIVSIFSTATANAMIRLVDGSGKTVMLQHYNVSKGNNQIEINVLPSLPTGVYTLQIKDESGVIDLAGQLTRK